MTDPTTVTLALAIDISNYTDPIDVTKAAALYAAGVRRAIVQFVNERVLRHRDQVPALLAAGIEVEGYVYVWFSEGEAFVRERVQRACTEFAVFSGMRKVLWLDCEQTTADTPPFDYVNRATSPTIRAAVEVARANGFEPGIYTAGWWWMPGVSNSREFADQGIPLWNAHYDLDPDIDPANYGGWTVPRMEQFAGWSVIAGVGGVDLDSYEVARTLSLQARAPRDVEELLAYARAVNKGAGAAVSKIGGRALLIPEGDPYSVLLKLMPVDFVPA